MPKLTHEAIVQLVRNAPDLIARLQGPERPPVSTSIHITHGEFVDLLHAEYRADNVILYGDDLRAPERVHVVEVQLQIDPKKPDHWQIYVAGLRVRYGCPVDLVVITVDRAVARWASRTICAGLSPGSQRLTPDVLGPDQIPVITELDAARESPELAVLSLAVHADRPGAEHIALAALGAAHDLDTDRAALYFDVIYARLGEAARAALEKLMQSGHYEFQSDIARSWFAKGKAEGEAKGKAEGEARVLLQLMAMRGLVVTDSIRERVLGTSECAVIERWVARVLDATTAEEILDG